MRASAEDDEQGAMLRTQRSDHDARLDESFDVDSPGGSSARRQEEEPTLRPRKGTHLFSSDAKKQGRGAKSADSYGHADNVFASERTLSRLTEMGSMEYLEPQRSRWEEARLGGRHAVRR